MLGSLEYLGENGLASQRDRAMKWMLNFLGERGSR